MVKARKVKGLRCDASVVDNARLVIETRLDEMLSFAPYVHDKRNVDEIHNLRIAAKRLRYTLELFRFGLPGGIGDLIDEVKEIQQDIGEMRDADVMIERVLAIVSDDAEQRHERLLDIATAVDRGTVSQRHQRIKSALASRTVPRDELACYTLIAHRAGDRDAAYERFIAAWSRMEETDFPTRLRTTIGSLVVDETEDEPEPADEEATG